MLQQSMTMAASAETALTDAQAELETCANARERALGEQLLASRREDRASKQHDAAHLAGTIVQERRQSEQSLEAWSRRKPA
ncbi:MAG TPA: hypothetical protein VM687_09940 [Stenotrophomonas sp.]|nr:hypothetical protein [Stenotrophomonas sp.]